LVGFIFKYFC